MDEVAIAEEFNLSRTPVRQALFQLAAAGLVEHIPQCGAFAAKIGPQQLSEMFEVIAEFEALCARRATAKDISDLTDLHRCCSVAAASGDSDAYFDATENFHAAIRAISGNSFLLGEAVRLQNRLQGDAASASTAMRAHVSLQGDRLADLLATLSHSMAGTAA